MPALVLASRYASITGDSDSAALDVEAALVDAVEQLEDRLGRPLGEAVRTESIRPAPDGMLWPKAVPLVTAPDGYTIDGFGLTGGTTFGSPWSTPLGLTSTAVAVTYTGGWVERSSNPSAPNRLPTYIERDLCFAAYRLLHPPSIIPASDIPAGATSARVGDVAVTWGPGGAPGGGAADDVLDGVWSAATLAWRHAPVGSK